MKIIYIGDDIKAEEIENGIKITSALFTHSNIIKFDEIQLSWEAIGIIGRKIKEINEVNNV